MAYKSIHDCGGAQNHSFFCPLDQLLGVFCVSNQNKNCWVFFLCVQPKYLWGLPNEGGSNIDQGDERDF